MEDIQRLRSPTPPLPMRNPNRRYAYPHWKAPVQQANTSATLVPKPLSLSRKRARVPPLVLHVEVHSVPVWSPSRAPSSPTASFKSFDSYASSASTVSGPTSLPRNLPSLHPFPPPPGARTWGNPSPAPQRRLRRTKSPRKESLRDIRAKQSELCLQRAYEAQLERYLNGALFPRAKWKDGLGCVEEE